MESLIRLIFPAICLTCDEMVEETRGLCPSCWAQTPFIVDPPCETCGRPLLGEARAGDLCEDCFAEPPPWRRGRTVMLYDGNARRLILSLKHGDRTDLARPAGRWMAEALGDVPQDTLLIPMPIHWTRLLKRRYNQAALLAKEAAIHLGCTYSPEGLKRGRATPSLDRLNRSERASLLSGAFSVSPEFEGQLKDRPVVLVDDVMTTGSSLKECARALQAYGVQDLQILTLARVASPF